MTAAEGTLDTPVLLTVPSGLALNTTAIDEYTKEDKNFRQLLDALGQHRVMPTLKVKLNQATQLTVL